MEMHHQKTAKSSPCEEENLKSPNKPDAIELSLQKLTRRIFEVELFQKIIDETKVKLRQKEQEEVGEIRKLEEIQYRKLEKMEQFCDKIWEISSSNGLCTVFDKYLDMPKPAHNKFVALDTNLDPNILKLKNERNQLNMQLAGKNATCNNLEKNLTELKIQLQILELYRYNNSEIIRLENSIEESRKKIESLDFKISKIEMGILEKNEKKELVVDGIDDKKIEFVRASELIEKSETIGSKKKSNFSVKKESAILRKISNFRGTNRSEL